MPSHRLALIGAAAGVSVLAGCSHETPGPALAAANTPSQSLLFTDDGANAKLATASGSSLMLECAHGSHAVHITHASDRGPAPTLTLISGGATSPLKASQQNFMGQTLVLAHAKTDIPALAAFRRSGVLTVNYAGAGVTAAAEPNAFFAACEGRKN
jgi:hypothetical protein